MYQNIETNPCNIAIVIHAFYANQLKCILSNVESIVLSAPQHISLSVYLTVSEASEPEVYQILDSSNLEIKVQEFPNYGMDLLPFFELLPGLQSFDWVLKLHTKNINDEFNRIWFEQLLEGLIGTPSVFYNSLEQLQSHKNWSMAGLMPFFLSANKLMLNNLSNVQKLAEHWQVDINEDWGFFAGSLYWIKPDKFLAAAKRLLKNKHWFNESFEKDGQMAHAVERLITKVALSDGAIGLFLPLNDNKKDNQSLLVSSSDHKYAINRVTTKELIESFKSLAKDSSVLENTSLLDTKLYSKDIEIHFESKTQAIKHYLLIGLHNGFDGYVYPLHLRKSERRLVNWQHQANLVRDRKLVSIVIPVFNNFRMTISCLQSVYKYTKNINYEIILLDNASTNLNALGFDLYSKIRKRMKVFHLSNNLNFSVGCNYAFSKSKGDMVVFLNNDTQVTKGWLEPMIKSINNPSIIAVQPKLLYFDDTVQCAGVEFGSDGFGKCRLEGERKDSIKVNQSCETQALTAACICIKAIDFIQLKGFDAWYINGQEDIDLCLRLKRLYPAKRLWYEASSTVYHHTSSSKGRRSNIEQNRDVFKVRWAEMFNK